ncbi:MAG TPA: hypothetical protein VMF89_00925 [Polyangiales bacterium]|nr:hypothetical protein [Polyangiales bacterium]
MYAPKSSAIERLTLARLGRFDPGFGIVPEQANPDFASVLQQLRAATPPRHPKHRPNKPQRMLERLFADAPRYVARRGTYSAMPWVLRRAIAIFAVREWMVLSYLYLGVGPESLVWLTDKQIATDLGVGHRKIGPHIRTLEQKGFLKTAEHEGVRYTLLLDPELALRRLAAEKALPPSVLDLLTDDFEAIGLEPLVVPPSAADSEPADSVL